MQITATPNDSLSARGWLVLALLLAGGLVLIGLAALRIGLLPGVIAQRRPAAACRSAPRASPLTRRPCSCRPESR